MKIGKETIYQIQIVNWVKQCTKLKIYKIDNEGKRTTITDGKVNPMQANIAKKSGLTAGMYDLILPKGNHLFKGLWLEVKQEKGILSPAQIQFGIDMIEDGYQALVCYSGEEGILMIKAFYGLE